MKSLLERIKRIIHRRKLNSGCFLVGILFIVGCTNVDKVQDSASGLHSEYAVYSKNVRDSFYISIQVPLEYQEQPTKNYPVVVLTDANFYNPMLAPILHQYEKGGLLPPVILIGVGYKTFSQMDSLRVRDYMFPASIPSDEMEAIGGGQRFYRFITDELLPQIDSNYRADSTQKTLLGHSFGGYFSLLALSEQIRNKRSDFTGFVSASPSLWYNDNYIFRLSEELANSSLQNPINIFLSVGAKEDSTWSIQPVKDFSRQLGDFRLKNVEIDTQIYSHLDHMDVGLISFIKGLKKIYNQPD